MTPIGAKNRRDWTLCREKVEREGSCRNCGDTQGLQAAHTIRRSQGGGQSEDSVIPLCVHCHAMEHAGALDLLPLLTRAEELEAVRVVGLSRAYRMLGGEL